MKHKYQIKTGRVVLRPLTAAEAQQLRILRNQNSQMFFQGGEITSKAQAEWYKHYLGTENDYMFSIYLLPDKRWIGAVSIYHVDRDMGRCEFGRLMIDHSATDERGLGVEATLAACQFAFQQLNLSSIYLEVFSDNLAAVKTYERAGFRHCETRYTDGGRAVFHMEKYKSER